jgi:hypothetical protein
MICYKFHQSSFVPITPAAGYSAAGNQPLQKINGWRKFTSFSIPLFHAGQSAVLLELLQQ